MKVHELKIWPEFFEAIRNGTMTCQVRKNDRDYQVGDILILREYFPSPAFQGEFSDRRIAKTITHIFPGGQFGLDPDYVVLSVK